MRSSPFPVLCKYTIHLSTQLHQIDAMVREASLFSIINCVPTCAGFSIALASSLVASESRAAGTSALATLVFTTNIGMINTDCCCPPTHKKNRPLKLTSLATGGSSLLSTFYICAQTGTTKTTAPPSVLDDISIALFQ